MELLKKHGTTIVISLVIGILLFYLQIPLKYIGDTFINWLTFISNSYSNSYFQSVGLNNPNVFDSYNNIILIFVMTICLFGTLRYLMNEKKKVSKILGKTLESIGNMKAEIQPIKQEIIISKDEMLAKLERTEKQVIQNTKYLSKTDNLMIMLFIISTFLVVLLFYNFAYTTAVSTENINFKNNLIKIAPYSSDIEIKTIQAKWTMMNNRSDYDCVTNIVSEIKKRNKIE